MKKIIMTALVALGFSMAAFAGDVPEYPGGKEAMDEYIKSNMVYPQAAKDCGIEGVVPVTFTVKADGSIGNIKIKRMIDPDLESEAIRLVKNMPKWQPADQNGSPVDAPAEVNISFSLE